MENNYSELGKCHREYFSLQEEQRKEINRSQADFENSIPECSFKDNKERNSY